MAIDFGKVRRWKSNDGILWAENDWIRMAYAVFDPAIDHEVKGFALGVRNGIFVELISAEQAKAFDDAPIRN